MAKKIAKDEAKKLKEFQRETVEKKGSNNELNKPLEIISLLKESTLPKG